MCSDIHPFSFGAWPCFLLLLSCTVTTQCLNKLNMKMYVCAEMYRAVPLLQAAGEAETSQFPFFIGGLLVVLAGVAALVLGPQSEQSALQSEKQDAGSQDACWLAPPIVPAAGKSATPPPLPPPPPPPPPKDKKCWFGAS